MKLLPCLCLCLLLPGCAFARRENRPVWNAFEQHLVPEDRTWFLLALPLTVPGGLLAIFTDTLVAHPIQVADDAWDDAASLWRNGRPDFDDRYYSEMAFLPVRTGLTPVTFLGSFLGRSMFDIDSKEDVLAAEARRQAREHDEATALRQAFLAWLDQQRTEWCRPWNNPPPTLDGELRAAIATTLREANALGRLHIFLIADQVTRLGGLRDADPGVRFYVLCELIDGAAVPVELQQLLLHDPVESIRLLARARWPAQAKQAKQE